MSDQFMDEASMDEAQWMRHQYLCLQCEHKRCHSSAARDCHTSTRESHKFMRLQSMALQWVRIPGHPRHILQRGSHSYARLGIRRPVMAITRENIHRYSVGLSNAFMLRRRVRDSLQAQSPCLSYCALVLSPTLCLTGVFVQGHEGSKIAVPILEMCENTGETNWPKYLWQ